MTQADGIRAITDAAAAWRDPAYPAREAAVKATLEAPNRFTEEGLAFALNHLTHLLRPGLLRDLLGDGTASESRTVGVVCPANVPLGGLSDMLAAFLLGHRVVVSTAPASPAILPGFVASVVDMLDESVDLVRFAPLDALFAEADALIASGEAEEMNDLAGRANAAGIPSTHRLLRRDGFVVAVIDGSEDAGARSGLAEDLLLHEGVSPRSAKVVWAPDALPPDAILDTLAGFRELYPAHSDTDGALRMPTAFLSSAKQPHATGPGFLLSKGDPAPQGPTHIRWATYDTLGDVTEWLRAHRDEIDFVVATESVGEQLDTTLPLVALGDAHRPALWDDGLLSFLASL